MAGLSENWMKMASSIALTGAARSSETGSWRSGLMETKAPDLSSKLAEFTVGFDLGSVPAKALENAKLAIFDCLGVAVLATRQEIGTILLNFARNTIGTGPCTIWGTALKTTPRSSMERLLMASTTMTEIIPLPTPSRRRWPRLKLVIHPEQD